MRRSLIPIIIIILLFAIPLDTRNRAQESPLNLVMDESLISSTGGAGSDQSSVLYISRDLTDWSTDILNSYESTNTHQKILDLSNHHIPGWTLFKAEMQVDNITAAPEREVLVTSPNGYIEIWNDTGDVYDALYQAFYFQSQDGKLENYSIGYRAPYYNSDNGDAYLGVWADYTDYTTAVTSLVTPFVQNSSVTVTTHDTSGDNAILSANTYYYVVINGTHMNGVPPPPVWLFNIIQWRSTNAFEGLDTGYHYRNDGLWYDYSGPIARQEAELNYTYTPWNSVGGAPWVYTQPEDVSLEVNSSAVTGSNWSFEATSGNITTLVFDSSQSAYVNHNITLWYKKTVATTNIWDVQLSGDIVDWNGTTVASYPSVSGTLARYANISVGGDWTVSGLYNSASPSVDYGNYVDYGSYIQCSNMYDETWTFTFTGYNHVTSLATNMAAVNSSVISILSDVDIDALIEESDSSAVTSGNANLTIWHDGTLIQPPQVSPVSDGTFSYAWDIDATETDNGTYSILLYWSNGTEAGYREIPVVVYFPTALTAATYYVEGYADSTVDISVYFNETFTPKALDGNFAAVVYYNGTHNNTMTDHANGTWTAAVDTTGWALGSYPITVYGEGYAIENRTVSITIAVVELSFKLDVSHVWWPDGNNISYIDSAQLRVNYSTSAGPVIGATVNVTDGTTFWNLNWDGAGGTYWVNLTGSDFSSGPGTYPLTVSAWMVGVETQVNDTLEIIIVEEVTILTPSWPSITFDYSQNVNFSVVYTDHWGTPIAGASQADITINGTTIPLIDAGNGTYWIELDKNQNLGNHSVLVTLDKLGYQTSSDSSIWFIIDIANTNVDVSPVSPMQVYYTHSDPLTITLTDDEGDPIDSAEVWLEYSGSNHTLHEIAVGVFQILINGSDGLGPYSYRVFTFNYGFVNKTQSGQIDIVETPTSLYADGTRIVGPYSVLYNDGSITFNVLYEDIDFNSLTSALVNVTINGKTYNMSAGPLNFTFTIEAKMIGIGSFSAEIRADLFGYDGATIFYPVVVEPVPTHIDTPDVIPSVMYLNQTLPTISLRYWDNNSGTWLDPDIEVFDWTIPLSESGPDASGWYDITLSSDQLSLGQHLLNITFARTNFTTASITMFITVRPVNTDFYVLGTYSTYENETVQLRVYYHDRDHDVPISWANVVATLVGDDYTMTYDGASIYIADIRADLEWGSYQFSISATATGCASNSTTVGLTLSEKDHVQIEIIHPVHTDLNPIEGESTNIAALVQYSNSVQTELMPLGSVSVQFLVTIDLSNGTTLTWSHADTTDDEGVASWSFRVPTTGNVVEISNMTVDAWCLGSTTRWGARADSTPVTVGFDPLQQLIRFLSTDLGIMLMLSLAVIGTVAVGYNKKFKPKKREAQRNLMRQLDSFKELNMLQHFMAVYIDRGTCVFYHPFKDTRIQPDLISGFIAAITSVYGEIKGNGVQGSLEEINYQGLRLNSYSGKFIIGIVIVEGDMSARLRDRLQFFVELFEDQYHTDLDGWTGLVDCFDPEWVVSNLNTAFNYSWMLPHQIVRRVRVKGELAKVLRHIHTKFGEGEFLLLGIVEEVAGLLSVTDAEAFDVLLRLEDIGAIKPISIHTVLQRQGLGIAEEDDGSLCETSARVEPEPEVVEVPPQVEEPEPEPEPEPVPEPEPEVVEAPEPEPEPVKEEKIEELSEEDKFLTDVFALMEEEEKDKKDKKKE